MINPKEIGLWVVCLVVGVAVSYLVHGDAAIYIWAPVAAALNILIHLVYMKWRAQRANQDATGPVAGESDS